MLFRSPISYPDKLKCYPQADTLQTNPGAFERSFPARNWQDAQSGISEASTWAHHLDQQFYTCWREGQALKLKLRIYLDPTNLNKAIVREPYHFKTLENIAHFPADACIMSVCNYKKGYWHQELDEASSFLTTLNTELRRFRYTVIPFGATVAGDVFQCKLDQCFDHLKNVTVIADNIMLVGNKPSNGDHDQALIALHETARKCNVQLNYEKLQYRKQEVDFFSETYTASSHKPDKNKVTAITMMPAPTNKK